MTTGLIIGLILLVIALIIGYMNASEDLTTATHENELLKSELETQHKKYDFIKEQNLKNFYEIMELKQKAKKWDAELERQRVKAANYRAKKQLSKNNK